MKIWFCFQEICHVPKQQLVWRGLFLAEQQLGWVLG
jgi:hypothetical protein